MTEIDRARERTDRKPRSGDTVGQTGRSDPLTAQLGTSALAQQATLPIAMRRALMPSLQSAVGNQAAQTLLGTGTIQRKSPSLSGVKKAVGLGGKKHRSVAEKVGEQAAKATSAKVVTVGELNNQIAMLESLTSKLVNAHQPGDTASQNAASLVNRAARRILRNLPDQESKASKRLGRMYPDQVNRLGRVVEETQLILDEVRVENTRRQAQNVYLEAGRTAAAGQQGALTKLGVRNVFDAAPAAPAPNAAVIAYLNENNFGSYEEAYDDALKKTATGKGDATERALQQMQAELFVYTDRSRSRAAARGMGLSAAELAAIQTFTAQDYRYINPATANDPDWLAGNFPQASKMPAMTRADWADLQDELAQKGQTFEQHRAAERRAELTALREEGGLHSGVALEGLRKLPVWRGTAYRGERVEDKRFTSRFVKDGDTFRPKDPTFTWKSITSISKTEGKAREFMALGTGSYMLIWEFEVTDARDIEGLSVNRREREVALLPGAEFAYAAIEVIKQGKYIQDFGNIPWEIKIKAKQIK
jgi:hypothetical protein